MPPAVRRHLRWLGPALVLAVAAVLRFWALGRPSTLVFDELFYVRDAISQLAHGYPTTWPDSDPDMTGARATGFSAQAANAVHPPLGKWLIGIGVLLFGPESGWGWRFTVALAGVATVAVTMRLGFLLTRSLVVACLAGLLLAIDGVHVTLSRVALLDGFLAFFIALGALFVWKDLAQAAHRLPNPSTNPERHESYDDLAQTPPRTRSGQTAIRWRRPWLLAAGLTFGAAAAVKWSGVYPLAFFLVFLAAWDLVRRLRSGSAYAFARSTLQALITAAITIPAAVLAYAASWTGWILRPGGHARTEGQPWFESLIAYHFDMFGWHSTLNAAHPYMAHPLSWPLALKPTAMYEERWSEGCPWGECVAGISALPNPIITWAGVAALVALVVLAIRRRNDPITITAVFVVTGYLSGWLPWVLTFSRSAVFQFYAVVLTPFAALALAILLTMLCSLPIRTPLGIAAALPLDSASRSDRRAAVALFLAFGLLLAVLFMPVWSAMPVADWFWRAHLWLPGWS